MPASQRLGSSPIVARAGTWKTVLGTLNYCVAVILTFLKLAKGGVNNRTGHSIAFAILFSWLIAAVFLSSLAGGFTNKRSAWRILQRLQGEFDRTKQQETKMSTMDDRQSSKIFCLSKESFLAMYPSLAWCGGNNSFRPHQDHSGWEMKTPYIAAIFSVLVSTISAVFISYTQVRREG